MVLRECIYYIHLRQAYLLSPLYAERLSSRTVLFTCVPVPDLDEHRLKKLFGDTVKCVWIPRNTEDLERLVKEKEETVDRLQKAEIKLVKKADLARRRIIKQGHGHPDLETGVANIPAALEKSNPMDAVVFNMKAIHDSSSSCGSNGDTISPAITNPELLPLSPIPLDGPLRVHYGYEPPPDINGSIAAQWIPQEARPTHRPLANYGRRVDTIKWTRSRVKELTPQIDKLRRKHRAGKGEPIPAVFIEFMSQADAQSAYQTLSHHQAFHMAAEIVGVNPDEIVWTSLRMRWYERILRKFLVMALIAVMVIFWAIPSALVGTISNIKTLAESVKFLSWILDLPTVVIGLISGLLPAIALSLLMSAVPGMVRGIKS